MSEELNFGKKKKSSKAPLAASDADAVKSVPPPSEIGNEENAGVELNFGSKKKKKVAAVLPDEELVDQMVNLTISAPLRDVMSSINIAASGRFVEYSYDSLLSRCYMLIQKRNPQVGDGKSANRLNLEPPKAARVGTKKTMLVNFSRICSQINRPAKHVMAFLFAEMGTTGSLDGSDQLLMKGKFSIPQYENVLRNYIREYVLCHTCRSKDTELNKDDRIFFLQCNSCKSRCSVASIKSGFQAVTSKRSAIRAKATT
jgi:translation initiation factor 2 subunit 2